MNENQQIPDLGQEKRDQWFGYFIAHIQADQFMLDTNCAPEEISQMYNAFINENKEEIQRVFIGMRKDTSREIIKSIVIEYIAELNKIPHKEYKLALGLSDSKIYAWAEIKDDDEETQDALLLAEAAINEKYYRHGFYLTSTIIEESDNLPIPNHYTEIPWRHSKNT